MKEDRSVFRRCLDLVMKNEGWLKTSNESSDKGGLTFCGITQKVYNQWCDENDLPNGPVYDMAGDVLEDIYYSYWNSCKCQMMVPEVAYQVFDIAVNSGPNRACRILQKSLVALGYHLTVDGVVGAYTLKVIGGVPATLLVDHIIIQRKKFYEKIVENDKSQSKFLDGWIARADRKFVDK